MFGIQSWRLCWAVSIVLDGRVGIVQTKIANKEMRKIGTSKHFIGLMIERSGKGLLFRPFPRSVRSAKQSLSRMQHHPISSDDHGS